MKGKKGKKERKKKKRSDAIKQSQSLITRRPMPRHSPSNGYFGKNSLSILLLSIMLRGMEYPFGQLGWAVPTVSSLHLLPILWDNTVRNSEKLYKHSSAISKIRVCWQYILDHQSKTWHHIVWCEKKLTPSQPDPVQYICKGHILGIWWLQTQSFSKNSKYFNNSF